LRSLANENLPGRAVAALEAAGYDIVWVRITVLGMPDPDVPARRRTASSDDPRHGFLGISTRIDTATDLWCHVAEAADAKAVNVVLRLALVT
jgi:hypothetical protein